MSDLLIALQLHSVRSCMESDFEGTLRKVKEMGYNGVELADFYGRTPAYIKQLLDEIGLVPVSMHTSYDAVVNGDPMNLINQCREAGCKQLVVAWMSAQYRPGSDQFPDVIRQIGAFGALCNTMGISLSYHNHAFEFVKVGDKYGIDLLLHEIPAEHLQMQFDTCWVQVSGESPAEYLRKYAGRTPTVHLKDYVGIFDENNYMTQTEEENPDAFFYRPVGYGVQDIPAIVQAAKEAGVTWFIVEQDEPSMKKTQLQCAEMSLQYLRSL